MDQQGPQCELSKAEGALSITLFSLFLSLLFHFFTALHSNFASNFASALKNSQGPFLAPLPKPNEAKEPEGQSVLKEPRE